MLRKLALSLVLLAAAAIPSKAQSTHSATIKWNASSDAAANPTLGYNVYKLQGPCPIGTTPTFTKVNTAPVTTLSYTDSSVSLGNVCYYVTATLNGVESVPSASAGGSVLPSAVTTVTVTVN